MARYFWSQFWNSCKWLLYVVVVGFFFYWFFTNEYMRISMVSVEKVGDDELKYIEQDEVMRGLRHLIGKHFLFVPRDSSIKFLEEGFDYIKSARFRFDFPSEAVILVEEYDPVGVMYQYYNDPLIISKEAKILPLIDSIDKEALFKIFIMSSKYYSSYQVPKSRYPDIFSELETVLPGGNIFSLEDIKIISGAYSNFDMGGIGIDYFVYFPIEKEIHFVLKNGTSLWMELGEEFTKQWAKFEKTQSLFFQDVPKLLYVDLRVNEKVILCQKNEDCEDNPHYLADKSRDMRALMNKEIGS